MANLARRFMPWRNLPSIRALRVELERCEALGIAYLVLHPGVSFAEQTKYLDDALHADARHESVAPPLLGSKIRNDMLRRFLKPGPGDRIIVPEATLFWGK